MGRHAGWIALYAGLAGGATAAIIPEQETDVDEVRDRIEVSFDLGKRFSLVIVAEGDDAGGARELAAAVTQQERYEVEHRVTSLGHMQRGGPPTMRDRVLGARLGDGAVTALLDGETRVMIGESRLELTTVPLEETWTAHAGAPLHLLDLLDRLAR